MKLATEPVKTRPRHLKGLIEDAPSRSVLLDRARDILNRLTNEQLQIDGLAGDGAVGEHGLEPLFRAYVRWLQQAGYEFGSLEHGLPSFDNRTVYLRYDVHVHDLLPALLLARLHEELKIPGSFQITWRFSPHEEATERIFLRLREFDPRYVQFGLHCSPNLTFLIRHKFDWNNRKSRNFFMSSEFETYVVEILNDYRRHGEDAFKVREILEGGRAELADQADSFYSWFGRWSSLSGHGHGMSAAFKRLQTIRPELREIRYLFNPPEFLNRIGYRTLGFDMELTTFDHDHLGSPIIFEASGDVLNRNYQKRIQAGRGFLALTHPATWTTTRFKNLRGIVDVLPSESPEVSTVAHLTPEAARSSMTITANTKQSHSMQRFGRWLKSIARRRQHLFDNNTDEGDYGYGFKVNDIVIVAGFARGGTTWTRNIIGGHPDIAMVPREVNFARLRQNGITRDSLLEKISAFLPADYQMGRAVVMKGPINSLVFDQMAELLPEAKFVYIIRDPRDVYVSHRRGTKTWMLADKNQNIVSCMSKTQRYYEGFVRSKNCPNVSWIYYENLHQNFFAETERLFDFLNVRNDPSILEEIRKNLAFRRQTGRSHSEKRDVGPRRGVIGDWTVFLNREERDWYETSEYWRAFFQNNGYDWRVANARNIARECVHQRRRLEVICAFCPSIMGPERARELYEALRIENAEFGVVPTFGVWIESDGKTSSEYIEWFHRLSALMPTSVSTVLLIPSWQRDTTRSLWQGEVAKLVDEIVPVTLPADNYGTRSPGDYGSFLLCQESTVFQVGLPHSFDPRKEETYVDVPDNVKIIIDAQTCGMDDPLALAFREDL